MIRFFLILELIALLGSYGGALHPIGDSLAIFRVPIALGCALFLVPLIWARGTVFWGGLIMVLLALIPRGIERMKHPLSDTPSFSIYQKNMLFQRTNRQPFINDVIARSPDFLTLQEVSTANRPVLDKLSSLLPSQHLCRFARVGGVAVASRWPAIEGSQTCAKRDGLAAMQVQTDNGPVWIVSLHLHWPYPYGQRAQVDRILPVLEGLDGPVIIGGDFNMVAWSHTMRRVTRATHTRRVGHVQPTFDLPKIPMSVTIDHVLAPDGMGDIEVLKKVGSDHRGVLARVAWH